MALLIRKGTAVIARLQRFLLVFCALGLLVNALMQRWVLTGIFAVGLVLAAFPIKED